MWIRDKTDDKKSSISKNISSDELLENMVKIAIYNIPIFEKIR